MSTTPQSSGPGHASDRQTGFGPETQAAARRRVAPRDGRRSRVLLTLLAAASAMVAVVAGGCSRQEPGGQTGHSAHHDHDHDHEHGNEPDQGMASAADGKAGGAFCVEHGVPESECGICNPGLVAGLGTGQGLKVRLPAEDSADLAGIEVSRAASGEVEAGIESFAALDHAQNRMALVTAPVEGIVQDVSAEAGQRVTERQTLARLWSATIAEAVARAVLTHQTLERERRLRSEKVTSEEDLQRAEAEHRAACQQLRTFGFEEEDVDAMGSRPHESVLLEVRSPLQGEVVARDAVRGERVPMGRPLFTVVDRSVMWAELMIPQSALGRVAQGQKVELTVDAFPDRVFSGTVTWIAPEIDERTRMARVRAEVENPDGALRAKMFARARILAGARRGAVVVPSDAVQRVEGRALVFVRLAADLYEARAVTVDHGARNGWVGVEGVREGEDVVVGGPFAVKSQLLVSRLGAGCVHD